MRPLAFTHTLKHSLYGICLASVLASVSYADGGSGKQWYRYQDGKGAPTISDQISEAHIKNGYDILNSQMQVISHVQAFDSAHYEASKAARDAKQAQQQADAQLRRLYATSRDAEIAERRQLDTLDTNMGYNKAQLMRLKLQRFMRVGEAAIEERTGRRVNAKQQEQIAALDIQIQQLETLVQQQTSERADITRRFDLIVKQLALGEQTTNTAPQLTALNQINR